MRIDNQQAHHDWIQAKLREMHAGRSILDVGAGECAYKPACSHLSYTSQDLSIYDGAGDTKGLQTGSWDFSNIDIRCDILDIPENVKYDIILCTEVLEHVPDPVRVLEKIDRVLAPGGDIILTAPFCSLTHFAPYHYSTGFSQYFYRYHLGRLDYEIIELAPNGGFFDYLYQELGRVPSVKHNYLGRKLSFWGRRRRRGALRFIETLVEEDMKAGRPSSELLTMGWHVHARKQ